jgi:hypothetical protein
MGRRVQAVVKPAGAASERFAATAAPNRVARAGPSLQMPANKALIAFWLSRLRPAVLRFPTQRAAHNRCKKAYTLYENATSPQAAKRPRPRTHARPSSAIVDRAALCDRRVRCRLRAAGCPAVAFAGGARRLAHSAACVAHSAAGTAELGRQRRTPAPVCLHARVLPLPACGHPSPTSSHSRARSMC